MLRLVTMLRKYRRKPFACAVENIFCSFHGSPESRCNPFGTQIITVRPDQCIAVYRGQLLQRSVDVLAIFFCQQLGELLRGRWIVLRVEVALGSELKVIAFAILVSQVVSDSPTGDRVQPSFERAFGFVEMWQCFDHGEKNLADEVVAGFAMLACPAMHEPPKRTHVLLVEPRQRVG